MSSSAARLLALLITGAIALVPAYALNPQRAITQYTRTVWTQEHGLPQDTIRAITETKDGYLWLGTDEGLAQFDGYDFIAFNKENGALPNNSVTVLCAAQDGSLWIGTPGGLTHYHDHQFTTYTRKDGLADSFVSSIAEDRSRTLWIADGVYLTRFENGKFTNFTTRDGLPIESMRSVYVGRDGTLYAAGFSGVARREGARFVSLIGSADMRGDIVSTLTEDRQGNLWLAGSFGLVMRSPAGKLRRFQRKDGLPDTFVRAVWQDRDGNLWAGTNGGLARFENGRFVSNPQANSQERDWVRCIFEDSQGNLWIGTNSGLNRLRDDMFAMYGESEGLPSDEPTTVFQDHRGSIWIGFHDRGLLQLNGGKRRVYTTLDGLPSNEIFSIREDHQGNLLIGTREGPSRMINGRFDNAVVHDEMGRRLVFDFLEDRQGTFWLALPSGVARMDGRQARIVIPGGPLLNDSMVVLCQTSDGSLWAGSYGQGLWQLKDGATRHFTVEDGLSSGQIRALREDANGTLWIGTFGGGLNAFRNGKFSRVTTQAGLLSDNVSHIEDDGAGSLWLSTTRGICRIRKHDVDDYLAGRTRSIESTNYGVADGLRSAQCAPGYPTGGGGTRSADGRLWFPTSRGLAVLDTTQKPPRLRAPTVHLLDVQVDGHSVPLTGPADFAPGEGRLQFRYTGINLSAPDRVRYSYHLEGLEHDWVNAVSRRVTNYNSLKHGKYRFVVRAAIAGGLPSEASFAFELRPHFYQTSWFLYFCVFLAALTAWGLFRLRVRQIRERFALVLEERTRLAREIHDTLAQGFVGISSQLDAVALTLNGRLDVARKHLDLARKMARHSLTEARRSVMDLRSSALEGQDLPGALSDAARQWAAGSSVQVAVHVAGGSRKLPEEVEQNVLRIAQEAVANTMKHAGAKEVEIRLEMQERKLKLSVADNGRGFEQSEAFSEVGGHFGLLGMRERAERLGGELELHSRPGLGTRVEVTVPLT